MDRGLAHFRGQHPLVVGRQGDGEIAVAAIQLQQVAAQGVGLGAGPGQHLPVHLAVGLGEGALDLLVAQLAAFQFEAFLDPVPAQDQFLPAAAADELDVEPLRQVPGGRFPQGAQGPLVHQGHQQFAAQGGEEVHAEQVVLEQFAGLQFVPQPRHHFADGGGGHGEGFQGHRFPGIVRVEHGVGHLALAADDLELGPQPVVQGGGAGDVGLGQIEGGEVGPVAGDLFGQQGVVGGGVDFA